MGTYISIYEHLDKFSRRDRIPTAFFLEEAFSALMFDFRTATTKDFLMSKRNYEFRGPFKIHDRYFRSLPELAAAASISYVCAYKRAVRGYSPSEILLGRCKRVRLAGRAKDMGAKRLLFVAGQMYSSIAEAHAAINPSVSLNTVYGRRRYGYSVEEALGIVPRTDGRALWRIRKKANGTLAVGT
jgi:hypothetical protein